MEDKEKEKTVKEAMKQNKVAAESISKMISSVISTISIPKVPSVYPPIDNIPIIRSPSAIREENEERRHEEKMDAVEALIHATNALNQSSAQVERLTWIVIALTIALFSFNFAEYLQEPANNLIFLVPGIIGGCVFVGLMFVFYAILRNRRKESSE